MSFTKNDQAVVLNRESLQYLANCIRLVHSLPDLLNDVLPSQTTTYSSYKVTELLNTLNTDLQNYVNNALGNLSHLKKEIVSVAPTDSSADEDTIYLVQDASGGYEQYLKINGVVTSLGSTSAINNVYTKTESDTKFALLSTLNSLITTVGGLNDLTTTDKTSIVNAINELKTSLTSITTHTNDTDIHITTAERTKWNEVDNKVDKADIIDNLTSTNTDKPLSAKQGKVLKGEVDLKANDNEVVKKTDITTTINSSSTDTQVPSAKAIYNKTKNRVIRIENGGDIIAYADSLGNEAVTETIRFTNSINSPYGANDKDNDFHYTIYNMYDARFKRIVAYDIRKNDMYMIMKYGGRWRTWQRLCATSVADVSTTTITFTSTTNYKQSTQVALKYIVSNGICYVSGGINCVSPSSSDTRVSTLPKPKAGYQYCKTIGVGSNATDTNTPLLFVGTKGELFLSKGLANGDYRCTFSYPVA